MSTKGPSLPADHAFVVQFRAQTKATPPRYEGRVEHLASGQAARFSSWEELQRFVEQMLRNVAKKLS